jgi:hypothetical protein
MMVSLVSVFVLGRQSGKHPTKEQKNSSGTSDKFGKSKHQKKAGPSNS